MEQKRISVVGSISLAFLLLPCCYSQDFEPDYLVVHNTARADVGASPLKWDAALASDSLGYIGTIVDTCSVDVDLSTSGLNVKVGADLTGSGAVNSWVSEKENYNYATNSCSPGKTCSHYTQVVWSSTTSVGCSNAKCVNGLVVEACKYIPAGNIPGIRPY